MANGIYPTGRSGQAVDYASAGANLFNTFVESRLKEIGEKKKEASEYEKKVLNAMSVQAIPQLSGKLRDKHQEKISAFKDELTSRLQKSGGKPTTADEIFIESRSAELQNDMLRDQASLNKWTSLQRNMANPNFMRSAVNAEGYTRDITDWHDKFMRGEEPDDPSYILTNNYRQPSDFEYVMGNYGAAIKNFDRTGSATIKDGKVTVRSETDRDNARDILGRIIGQDANLKAKAKTEEQKSAMVEEMLPLFIKDETTEKQARRSGSGSGSGAKAIQLTGEKGKVGVIESDDLYEWTPTGTVSPTGTAIDADTGEEIEFEGFDNAKIIKFDLTKGDEGIVLETKTGAALKDNDGDVLFVDEKFTSRPLKDQKRQGKTMADIEARKESLLEGMLPDKYDRVEDVRVEKEGNIIRIIGTAKPETGIFRKDREDKEITKEYVIAKDPTGKQVSKMPLNRNTYQYLGKNADRIVVPYEIDGKMQQVRLKDLVGRLEDQRLTGGDEQNDVSMSGNVGSMGRGVGSVQSVLDANKDKNFVKRILKRGTVPDFDRGGGVSSSHSMMYGESDGKFIVFPSVVEKNGELVDLAAKSDSAAFEDAMKNNNFISFDNEDDAKWFSENYKRVWGEEFAPGGSGNADSPSGKKKIDW